MPPKRSLIVLTAAVAVVYGAWAIASGIRIAVDTPTYSRWADLLIAADFNVAAYLRESSFVAPPLLYLMWIVVLAVLKTLLGGYWMTGVVALNYVSLVTGASATIAAIRHVTQSTAGMLLATALLFTAAELLIFLPYVLSDLMFWGLSTLALALGVRLASSAEGEKRTHGMRPAAIGTAVVMLALVFRPVAIPLAVFWVMAIFAWLWRPRVPQALLLVAAVAAFGAILIYAYVLANPSRWPFGPLPGTLAMVAHEAREGMFVHNASPPMLVEPATDFPGFLRITLQKLMFFVTPWLPHYSTAHTLMNLAFFLPAYGLSIAAITSVRRLLPPQQRAAVVLAIYVLVLAVFHAMLLIDSDHRYRLPMLPALIMLSALGLESARRPQTLASIGRTK